MNKTKLVWLLPIGGFFVALWIVGRLTHVIDFYTFATPSNMPTHKTGELFFASRLKTPDYGNFVCYRSSTKSILIHRVIGKPGDVIEIKDAIVFRNGQPLNEPYAWNQYVLSKKQYESVQGYIQNRGDYFSNPTDSTYMINLTDEEVRKYKLEATRYVTAKGIGDPTIDSVYNQKAYNPDNMGPVVVPKNCYFLMGDSRHDALDSRYIGFIKASDIVSTKLSD